MLQKKMRLKKQQQELGQENVTPVSQVCVFVSCTRSHPPLLCCCISKSRARCAGGKGGGPLLFHLLLLQQLTEILWSCVVVCVCLFVCVCVCVCVRSPLLPLLTKADVESARAKVEGLQRRIAEEKELAQVYQDKMAASQAALEQAAANQTSLQGWSLLQALV